MKSEGARAASRKHYAAHRDTEIARSQAWNVANRERYNANQVKRRSTKLPPSKVLWWNARNRAIAKGIEFSLTLEDVAVPTHCPVLGIPLVVATGFARDGSPSVDRIDPTKGYVTGNVCVISHKANTIKSNACVDDLRRVLAYMEAAHAARNT